MTGPQGTLDMAALRRAVDTIEKIAPTQATLVSAPWALEGHIWKVLDDPKHTYFFVHPKDLEAIPYRRSDLTGEPLWGVPVREFDGEMREVWIRALERMAKEAGEVI